jgi:hypothetical protein
MLLEQKNLICKPSMFSKAYALLSMVFLTVLVLTACSETADVTIGKPQLNSDGSPFKWVPVSSKSGRFELLMPGVPKVETNDWSSRLGNAKMYSLTTQVTSATAFAFFHYDFPSSVQDRGMLSSNWPITLKNIRNNLIGDDGKLISEISLETNELDVTELVMEKANGTRRVIVRIYPRQPTIFVACVVLPNKTFVSPINPNDGLIASNDMARFFDSIEFRK